MSTSPQPVTERLDEDHIQAVLRMAKMRAEEASATWQPPPAEEVGKMLEGKFDQVEFVGRGGMAAVYRGRHILLEQTMAIKLPGPKLREPADLERFREEARKLIRLQHERVVRVFDCAEVDGLPYLAMELIEGQTLSAMRDILSAAEKLNVVTQVCQALIYLHRQGVIHRDVKPDNLMIWRDARTQAWSVKIVDFGIACLSDGTAGRTRVWTDGFGSPEQTHGLGVSDRTDIYSLGRTLCWLFTGSPSPELSGQEPISPQVAAIIEKACKLAPEDRYMDAQAMEAALHQAQRGELPVKPAVQPPPLPAAKLSPPPLPPKTPFPGRQPNLHYAIAVATGAALVLGWWLGWIHLFFLIPSLGVWKLRWVTLQKRLLGFSALVLLWWWAANLPVSPDGATASKPFINSLDMHFVPLPETRTLISARPVSVETFLIFADDHPEINHRWATASLMNRLEDRKMTEPASAIRWRDAALFCEWLGRKEQRHYRLPTSREWKQAVGPSGQKTINGLLVEANNSKTLALAALDSDMLDPVKLSFPWLEANPLGVQCVEIFSWEWCSDPQPNNPSSYAAWHAVPKKDGTAAIFSAWYAGDSPSEPPPPATDKSLRPILTFRVVVDLDAPSQTEK